MDAERRACSIRVGTERAGAEKEKGPRLVWRRARSAACFSRRDGVCVPSVRLPALAGASPLHPEGAARGAGEPARNRVTVVVGDILS